MEHINKTVLLYSGGMDSYILYKNYNFDKVLFFNFGTEDNKKELEYINTRISKEFKDKITIIDLPLISFELDNKIIPYRNHIITLIASNFGNQLYLGFTKGDTTKDKDYVFKGQVESILNYFSLDVNKVAHSLYPYELKLPYKNSTKSMMLKDYIDNGHNIDELLSNSRSCYKGGDKECGKCRSCLRKYIAFKCNNIDIRHYFINNPINFIKEFQEESIIKNRQDELDDINYVIDRIKNEL